MAAATLVSSDEFLALPRTGGIKRERIDGEVVEVEVGKRVHEWPKTILARELTLQLGRRSRWQVISEIQFRLGGETDVFPDVGLISRERLLSQRGEFLEDSPEIPIEVVSSETAQRLQTKLDLYFQYGALEAWVLYPNTKKLVRHLPDGSATTFGPNDIFSSPLVPEFQIRVGDLFLD
ncbi:MAG: Uma2 family endonuclease [Bryobacteraceae bacterium]|nr:Uma2 family endonuclease [Bryobacteraceae bacterium]